MMIKKFAAPLMAFAVFAIVVILSGTTFVRAQPATTAALPKRSTAGEPVEAPPPIRFDPKWLSALKWRSIGPATMGGRIVDLAVVESDPTMFYVATASGGLFKTTNNGTTFTPVFERENTVSIGDVCVAPSDPNVVWVGTGEHNARNSVSYGDGVYKSLDGGKSWQHMGLKQSFQIGRIVIDPKNPEIVYVGALGRLWGSNEQRGVFKTTDGGKHWKKVLYVDAKTGCVDIAIHPKKPDTLIAAMYERQRDEFDTNDPAKRWGPGSGLYKTTDGGKKWTRLSGGLPTVKMGRIGVSYYRKNPDVVYSIIETEKIGTGPVATAFMGISGSPRSDAVLTQITRGGPAAKAGLKPRDRVLRIGKTQIKSYNDLLIEIRKQKPGDKVTITVKRGDKGDKNVEVELTFAKRPGKPPTHPYGVRLGGQKANAQEIQGKDGFQTGGVYKSTDGGQSWQRINSINPRPFYYSQIRVDPSDDKHIYIMGIQLHRSTDGGHTFRPDAGGGVHPDHHAIWIDPRDGRHLILGCDGGLYVSYDRAKAWDFVNIMDIGQFYSIAVDNRPLYRVYGGLQDNGSWGGPSRRRGRVGPRNSDWYLVGGGDGFICAVDPENPDLVYYEMQNGVLSRVNIRTGRRAGLRPRPPKGQKYRFHWKTPFILSHHNSRIYYCAGNYVFRSLNRGAKPKRISPEITRTKRGSATALAESPVDSNVLYVGSDDGALWMTRDGGHQWVDVAKNVGLPGPRHVATIEASRFAAGRAYVTFDGHRSDDDAPHVYVTEDYGNTWRSLSSRLPSGSSRCMREDVENENLLYLGTEFAIWCSVDRGESWIKLNNNLPTVAVHEIAVHPTAGEIVAGTHGRSAWVLDVAPLRQLTRDVRAKKTHLFQPATAVQWAGALSRGWRGHRNFEGDNPAYGARLYFFLAENAKSVALKISDLKGNELQRLKPNKTAGLHSLSWNLRGSARRGRRPRIRGAVPAGVYQITLTVDGKDYVQDIKVQSDPEFPAAMLMEELEYHESKKREPVFE